MDHFTPTIWRRSHAHHSYSEDPNQPINMPPIGESSSIQHYYPAVCRVTKSAPQTRRPKGIWLALMTLDINTMVIWCLSPVLVHQQCPALSAIRLLSQLGRPVRMLKHHSSTDINFIVLASLFPNSSVGHPVDVPHGQFMSHYSEHQPTEYYLGPYTSAIAMEPCSFPVDLTSSTNTNPPQLPTSLISHPGNLGATDPFSLDAQGHVYPTLLQSPLPTTSNGVPFFSQPPSR